MSHSVLPVRPLRLASLFRFLVGTLAAFAAFQLQACLVAPEDTNALAKIDTLIVRDTLTLRDTVLRIDSARVLDGMWEFLGGTSAWDENGDTGVDTFAIDTANPFDRQFYLIGGGLLVWMRYDENSSENSTAASAHSFRRLNASRWLIDSEDTATVSRRGDTLTFLMISVEEEYDPYTEETYRYTYRDSVNFRLYRGAFPLAAWLSGLSPDDYPTNVTPIAADGSSVASYLEAGEPDWYRFSATAGVTYRIGTTGIFVDTYIELFDVSAGATLDEDDDSGEGVNAMLLWTCPATGEYHLKVRGYDEYEEGQYGLIVGPDETTVFPVDTSFVNPLPRVAAPVSKAKRAQPLLDRLRRSTAKVP